MLHCHFKLYCKRNDTPSQLCTQRLSCLKAVTSVTSRTSTSLLRIHKIARSQLALIAQLVEHCTGIAELNCLSLLSPNASPWTQVSDHASSCKSVWLGLKRNHLFLPRADGTRRKRVKRCQDCSQRVGGGF